MRDLTAMVRRIGGLLARLRTPSPYSPSWDEVETLLTDGYALTHRLEAERARRVNEAGALDEEIRRLRALLGELRGHRATLPDPPS